MLNPINVDFCDRSSKTLGCLNDLRRHDPLRLATKETRAGPQRQRHTASRFVLMIIAGRCDAAQ